MMKLQAPEKGRLCMTKRSSSNEHTRMHFWEQHTHLARILQPGCNHFYKHSCRADCMLHMLLCFPKHCECYKEVVNKKFKVRYSKNRSSFVHTLENLVASFITLVHEKMSSTPMIHVSATCDPRARSRILGNAQYMHKVADFIFF